MNAEQLKAKAQATAIAALRDLVVIPTDLGVIAPWATEECARHVEALGGQPGDGVATAAFVRDLRARLAEQNACVAHVLHVLDDLDARYARAGQ